MRTKRFYLYSVQRGDGNGILADGIEFEDGHCLVRWLSDRRVEDFSSPADLREQYNLSKSIVVGYVDKDPIVTRKGNTIFVGEFETTWLTMEQCDHCGTLHPTIDINGVDICYYGLKDILELLYKYAEQQIFKEGGI